MIRLLTTGAACLTLGVAILLPAMPDEQSFSKTHRDAFRVIGIEARTTNAQEMSGGGAIPKMWGRLLGEELIEKIPNRRGSEVIALYTDYAGGDKDGAYTFILGAPVSSEANAPAGMVERSVPAGDYAMLATGQNPAPDAVVHLWQQVWQLETARKISRAYRTDYEVHYFSDRREKSAELYVGIKE